jgi:hypothetical protein
MFPGCSSDKDPDSIEGHDRLRQTKEARGLEAVRERGREAGRDVGIVEEGLNGMGTRN